MRVRRCAVLWLEPREVAHFELEDLLAGGTGVISRMQWFVHVPYLPAPVEIDAGDATLLGDLSPSDWVPAKPLREAHGAMRVRRLLQAGLLVGSTRPWAAQRETDERFRDQQKRCARVVLHQERQHECDDGIRAGGEP